MTGTLLGGQGRGMHKVHWSISSQQPEDLKEYTCLPDSLLNNSQWVAHMPQDFFEKNPTAKFLFSQTPMNPWICFGEIFMYYDYEVLVFISMIFQKQCKHILDYLGTPLHWVFPSGDNQKWQQLTFNTRLLKPEVHVWMEQSELRYGRYCCGQKLRNEWKLLSSYSSLLACSVLTGSSLKHYFKACGNISYFP